MKVTSVSVLFSAVSAKTFWHQLDGYSFADYVTEFSKTYATTAARLAAEERFAQTFATIVGHNKGRIFALLSHRCL